MTMALIISVNGKIESVDLFDNVDEAEDEFIEALKGAELLFKDDELADILREGYFEYIHPKDCERLVRIQLISNVRDNRR